MHYIIDPPHVLQADVNLPASKSISNRALIIQALTPGAPTPFNLSDCDDTRVLKDALRLLPSHIDIGPAGTAMRFLTAYLAITPGEHTLTGSEPSANWSMRSGCLVPRSPMRARRAFLR